MESILIQNIHINIHTKKHTINYNIYDMMVKGI